MWHTKNISQGVYYLRLFFIIILLALSYLIDFVFVDLHPWIEAVWIIPIVGTAIFLGPIETLGISFLALILSLGVSADEGGEVGLWASAGVGLFGVVIAIISNQVRRSFAQANIVREALNDSPLAYAELGFPGYVVLNHNRSLKQLTGIDQAGDQSLPALLPEDTGARLSDVMDKAVVGREQVNEPEFKIIHSDGRTCFWNINAVPMRTLRRRTPKTIAFFASDVTDAVQRASNREAALRISSAVMSNLDLEETLAVALESLMFIAGTNAGILFLLEDDQWLGMAGAGEYDNQFARKLRLPYEELPSGVRAVQQKQTLAVANAAEDTRISGENRRRLSMRSAMVVPLTTGTRAIGGVCCVQTDTERSFSDEQVEFATVVGTQIALAIENASIYDNEYTMRKSLEAIEAISEAGLASLDMEEVLIQLVTRTQDVMQMDAAMILLVDDQEENLEVRAATGLVASPLATKSIAIGEGLPGKAFKRGMPMKIDNISDYDTEMCPFGSNTGITSVMAVPLKIEGKTAGVLQIGSLCESAFAAREWGLIQVLADRASHAVQNSMLHEQTRKELARAALLRDVAAACASSRDIVKIADRSLEAIHKHLGCEVASIYDLDTDEEQLTSLASTGHPEDLKDEILTVPLEGDTFLVRAVLQQTIITHDSCPTSEASETELAILRTLDALDSRRAAMPIIYRGEVIGGMALTMPGCHPFTPMELDTLKSITDQLAVALHGSRLADDNRVPPQVDD